MLLLFQVLVFSLWSQVFQNYTTADGLCSNEVYDVFEDSKGYLWFATSSGVSRYDGAEFVNFDVGDGLPGNTIFGFFEDSQNRLWFRTFNGKLGYFDMKNSKLRRLHFEQDIRASHIISITERGCSIIITFLGWHQLILNGCSKDLNEGVRFRHLEQFTMINALSLFDSVAATDLSSLVGDGVFLSINFQYRKRGDVELVMTPADIRVSEDGFQSYESLKLPQNTIRGISEFMSDGKSFFYFHGDSISRYSIASGTDALLFQLPDPSNLTIDKNGGYWVSSLTNGVFYCRNQALKSVPELRGKSINMLDTDGNSVYFSMNRATLGSFRSPDTQLNTLDLQGEIRGMQFVDGLLVRASATYIIKQNEVVDHANSRWFSVGDGSWGRLSTGLDNRSIIEVFPEFGMKEPEAVSESVEIPSTRYRDIFLLGEQLILTKLLGYDKLDLSRNELVPTEEFLNNFRISDIDTLNEHMVFSTRGGGIIISRNGYKKQYLEKNGLLSNVIFKCQIHKGFLWLCTPRGITKVPVITSNGSPVLDVARATHFTSANFLRNDHVQDLTILRDTVYFATHDGLYYFHTDTKPEHIPPVLHIDYFQVGNKVLHDLKGLVFGPDEDVIQVSLSGIHYVSQSRLRYAYKLGEHGDWVYTSSNALQFFNLEPGEYLLYVKCETRDGASESAVRAVRFTVLPAFYETWWFRALIGALILLLILVFVFLRFKVLRKRIRLKYEMYKLENQAVRAQLNPHFIFNALNSIQNFVSKNTLEEADFYLGKFSKLIRWVLEDGKDELITIDKEIEFLNYYILLEQMRLKQKFTFEITVSDEIDIEEYLVPAFVVQPYVENSIWHGIQPMNGPGKIDIRIDKLSTGISIVIADNGVGIGEHVQEKDTKSLGMKLTQKRIELIREIHGFSVDVHIDSSTDPENSGTRVEIKITKQ